MPSASDTAYPRLKTNPSAKELGEIYAPAGWQATEMLELAYPKLAPKD
jgi:hypothetical protein